MTVKQIKAHPNADFLPTAALAASPRTAWQSFNQAVQLEASPWKARVCCHTDQQAQLNDAPTKAQTHAPRCPFKY
jgi:hypothetical protein